MTERIEYIEYRSGSLPCIETIKITHAVEQKIAANPNLLKDKLGNNLSGRARAKVLHSLGALTTNTVDEDGFLIPAIRFFGGVGDSRAVWREIYVENGLRRDPEPGYPAYIDYAPGGNIISSATSYTKENPKGHKLSTEEIRELNALALEIDSETAVNADVYQEEAPAPIPISSDVA